MPGQSPAAVLRAGARRCLPYAFSKSILPNSRSGRTRINAVQVNIICSRPFDPPELDGVQRLLDAVAARKPDDPRRQIEQGLTESNGAYASVRLPKRRRERVRSEQHLLVGEQDCLEQLRPLGQRLAPPGDHEHCV